MIRLRTTTTDDPVFRELEQEQVAEVMRRYDSDDPGPPVHGGLTAVVAEEAPGEDAGADAGARAVPDAVAGTPAVTSALGCVALSPLEPGVAEVKRVFVRETARGRGIARRMLAEIERAAGESGVGILKLEVGERQPEALALYLSEGWTRTDSYGYWKDSPLVVCLEKQLPGSRGAA